MITRLTILVLLILSVVGCTSSRYAWNGYDEKLYDYYKSPAESEKFIEQLSSIISDGESDNRVPPGIYAEYGYLLFEKGRFSEAEIWFRKEADKWPESRFFMTKMSSLAHTKAGQKQPAPKGNPSPASTPLLPKVSSTEGDRQ